MAEPNFLTMKSRTVTLASETDAAGFRREARALLSCLVAPDQVRWQTARPSPASLFTTAAATRGAPPHAASAGNLLLPRSFLSLCDTVILHKSPSRLGLLYELLWRAVHEPGLMGNPLDPERLEALHMAQAVRRDMQKMKALIVFRSFIEEVEEAGEDAQGAPPLQLAWYEPDHHILERMAPFFARRQQAPWTILTPERSVRWRREQLEFAPGVPIDDVPSRNAPAREWLDCYRAVFRGAAADADQPAAELQSRAQ